ncbi:MAG TPA: phosphate ABC transporter substrate-binding protein PstS [Candidatus Acidoferrales bacterium]|nr:phosphate ABC transporter substrate-binding protein PstS [Candidatus Acidoferrales bacterium]
MRNSRPGPQSTGLFLLYVFLAAAVAFQAAAQETVMLVGVGTSLPEPLYNVWSEEFMKQDAHIHVRYLVRGTGEGMRSILSGSGDFGAGDAPIAEQDLKTSQVPIVELPSVLIGIVIVYNLSGAGDTINLTGPVLADIYLGKITNWADPEIARLNHGAKLPSLPIFVVHRTEGKGSSYIFSDFLSKSSHEFQAKVGRSISPKWPVGAAEARSEEMVGKVKATPGAIGYTELKWAVNSGLPCARIRNPAGEYVNATVGTIAAAATASASKMTEDFRISLTDAPGKESYPISSFTWIYVQGKGKDPVRTKAVLTFLNWAFSDGQKVAVREGYAALPAGVLEKVRAKMATIR